MYYTGKNSKSKKNYYKTMIFLYLFILNKIITIMSMKKRVFVFFMFFVFVAPCFGALQRPDKFINKSLYQNIYPSTLNNTREKPDASEPVATTKIIPSGNQAIGKRKIIKRSIPARAAVQTAPGGRRVVQRPQNKTVRAATQVNSYANTQQNTKRNVVARSAKNKRIVRNANTKRQEVETAKTYTATSSQRCFADYKECMESYCKREDTAYNRCFCSAKLAQIDAKYQTKIDSLMEQIVRIQGGVDVDEAEIEAYWDETVGQITKTNPWVNINNALNIDWAASEDRLRGQNAFNTGHQYCVQHLHSCFSMASNMRDAYKSEIARDCAAYEQSLQKIQAAAESVIENYND